MLRSVCAVVLKSFGFWCTYRLKIVILRAEELTLVDPLSTIYSLRLIYHSSKYSASFDKHFKKKCTNVTILRGSRCQTRILINALFRYLTHFTGLDKPKEKSGLKTQDKFVQCLHVFLWGVQVWGLLLLARGSQMVFVCDGEQQRYSGGSFHRSALISLFHLQALRSYKHPQSTALWCFGHCVYSEKSGKYMNFKTKRTRMNNALSGEALELVVVKKYKHSKMWKDDFVLNY